MNIFERRPSWVIEGDKGPFLRHSTGMRIQAGIHREAWLMCLMPVPLWLLAAALESEFIATLAAILGAVLAVSWWRRLVANPGQMLGFLKLGGVSLLAIMSLSWLVALYFNVVALHQPISHALQEDVRTTLSAFAGAVAYALVFAAVLAALGSARATRQLEASAVSKLLAVRSIPIPRLLKLLVVVCALEIWLVLTGTISYRAFTIEGYETGQLAWFIPMLETMFTAQTAINALVISRLARRGTLSRRLLILAVLLSSVVLVLFINFTKGRGPLVLCTLLHLYWVCFFLGRMPKLSRLVPAILVALPLMYGGSLISNFMRSGNVDLNAFQGSGFLTLLSSALQTWQSDEAYRTLEKASSAANMASRPLVAHPLAQSMALPTDQKQFLLGENLRNSVIAVFPRVLFPSKVMYPIQEDLLYRNFPIGGLDTADSPYLYAYADFGYAGLLLYPLVLASLWLATMFLISTPLLSGFGTLVICGSWISYFTLYIGETSMVSWFSEFRGILIILPVLILITKLLGLSGRRASAAG
ncbi:MAG: hypothetical protein ACT4PZ_20105 [Panacagrimonas sp.]